MLLSFFMVTLYTMTSISFGSRVKCTGITVPDGEFIDNYKDIEETGITGKKEYIGFCPLDIWQKDTETKVLSNITGASYDPKYIEGNYAKLVRSENNLIPSVSYDSNTTGVTIPSDYASRAGNVFVITIPDSTSTVYSLDFYLFPYENVAVQRTIMSLLGVLKVSMTSDYIEVDVDGGQYRYRIAGVVGGHYHIDIGTVDTFHIDGVEKVKTDIVGSMPVSITKYTNNLVVYPGPYRIRNLVYSAGIPTMRTLIDTYVGPVSFATDPFGYLMLSETGGFLPANSGTESLTLVKEPSGGDLSPIQTVGGIVYGAYNTPSVYFQKNFGKMSLELWVKIPEDNPDNTITRGSAGIADIYAITVYNGKLRFSLLGVTYTTTALYDTDTWTMLNMYYDGGTRVEFYINAVKVHEGNAVTGSSALTTHYPIVQRTASDGCLISVKNISYTGTKVDQVRMRYHYANAAPFLSQPGIAVASALLTESPIMTDHGTIAIRKDATIVDTSVSVGTDRYYVEENVLRVASGSRYTVDIYVRFNTKPVDDVVFERRDHDGNFINLRAHNSAFSINFKYYDRNYTAGFAVGLIGGVPTGVWRNLIYDFFTNTMYYNGVLLELLSVSGSISNYDFTAGTTRFGNFNGSIRYANILSDMNMYAEYAIDRRDNPSSSPIVTIEPVMHFTYDSYDANGVFSDSTGKAICHTILGVYVNQTHVPGAVTHPDGKIGKGAQATAVGANERFYRPAVFSPNSLYPALRDVTRGKTIELWFYYDGSASIDAIHMTPVFYLGWPDPVFSFSSRYRIVAGNHRVEWDVLWPITPALRKSLTAYSNNMPISVGWHHLVVSAPLSSANPKIYLDTVQVTIDEIGSEGVLDMNYDSWISDTRLMYEQLPGSSNSGCVTDGFCLYNIALTQAQVITKYNGGAGTDVSIINSATLEKQLLYPGRDNPTYDVLSTKDIANDVLYDRDLVLEAVGTVTAAVGPQSMKAVYGATAADKMAFEGDQIMKVLSAPHTIEAWVKIVDDTKDGVQIVGLDANTNFGYFIDTDGKICVYNPYIISREYTTTVNFFDNAWHHVVLVVNTTDSAAYVDSVAASGTTVTRPVPTIFDRFTMLNNAYSTSGGNYISGFRIYEHKLLTSDNVATRFAGNPITNTMSADGLHIVRTGNFNSDGLDTRQLVPFVRVSPLSLQTGVGSSFTLEVVGRFNTGTIYENDNLKIYIDSDAKLKISLGSTRYESTEPMIGAVKIFLTVSPAEAILYVNNNTPIQILPYTEFTWSALKTSVFAEGSYQPSSATAESFHMYIWKDRILTTGEIDRRINGLFDGYFLVDTWQQIVSPLSFPGSSYVKSIESLAIDATIPVDTNIRFYMLLNKYNSYRFDTIAGEWRTEFAQTVGNTLAEFNAITTSQWSELFAKLDLSRYAALQVVAHLRTADDDVTPVINSITVGFKIYKDVSNQFICKRTADASVGSFEPIAPGTYNDLLVRGFSRN